MTSLQDVNPAVRGIREPTGLHSLAARITRELAQGAKKPFKKVIDVSAGDPHRAGMPPVSFLRQVLAACAYPELLKDERLPVDVRQRATELLGACGGGSVGSYSTTSTGLPHVQERVAGFITRRDGGLRAHAENICLSCGSQKILSMVLHLMASGRGETQTGVLTPAPCPHTLPMLLDASGVTAVPYQLMEDQGWALDLDQVHRALEAARGRCKPRAIYISNPGNPTGQVQDRKSMEAVLQLAATEGLVVLAEEVFQDSVYGPDKEFLSYKKVLSEMGQEFSQTVELISINSISGPALGECGLRGGYMEVVNMDPLVRKYLWDVQASCSPPIIPQLALEVMTNPPAPGDPSYHTYAQERRCSQTTLSHNAKRACHFLNGLPGMSCRPAMAGVFLYPALRLPPRLMAEAKVLGAEPDELYCRRLLEEEGVFLGAGCENGSTDPNLHVRLCVLAPPPALDEVLTRLGSFHLRLLDGFPRQTAEHSHSSFNVLKEQQQ